MNALGAVLGHGLVITGFVFVMMLLVEYLNVATRGTLQRFAVRPGLGAYAGSVALGIAPGCLGSFAAVSLYAHGALPFGALVANMIATSGDEAFVMLALFPRRALLLFALLAAWGIVVGWLVDRLAPRLGLGQPSCATGLVVHEDEPPPGSPFRRRPFATLSRPRALLTGGLALFALAVVSGLLGPRDWGWMRITLLSLTLVALWIVLSVSDHFLEEHLYRHVARRHLPRLLGWVLGVLLLLAAADALDLPLAATVRAHPRWALLLAALVGIVPESGPHLVFVSLFSEGAVPFSVLATSSVVQDGHGMLPLLAESRGEFLKVKAVSLAAGLLLGGVLMACGF